MDRMDEMDEMDKMDRFDYHIESTMSPGGTLGQRKSISITIPITNTITIYRGRRGEDLWD